MSGDTSSFARGPSVWGGKLSAKVTTHLSDAMKDELVRRSRDLGYSSESDCVRDLIGVWLRGAEEIMKVQAERLSRLTIAGSEVER